MRSSRPIRLGVIASHFIQYQAPLWRELAKRSARKIDRLLYSLPGLETKWKK